MTTSAADPAGGGAVAGPGIRVATADEIAPEGALLLSPALTGWPTPITVFRDGDGFFALDDTCSHAEASLSEGYLEDGCIECPLHGALFRLSDGAALSLPATRPVRAHRVAVVDDVITLWPGVAPD